MHYGHQRSRGVRETEIDPRIAHVAEHAGDAVTERNRPEGRPDVAGSQSRRGRRAIRPHVPVRRHVLAIRRQDRPSSGHQARFLQRRDPKELVQHFGGIDQHEHRADHQHERRGDTAAAGRCAHQIQRKEGNVLSNLWIFFQIQC